MLDIRNTTSILSLTLDGSSTGNSGGGRSSVASDEKRPIIMRVTGGTASFTNQKEDTTASFKQVEC